MPGGPSSLSARYADALKAYLQTPGEETLRRAGELGTLALESELGILDALAVHAEALAHVGAIVGGNGSAIGFASAGFGDRANEFLHALLSPFDQKFHSLSAMQLQFEPLNQTVRELREQIETADKELESFRYSVSHDLRAPLRAIDGFSAILAEEHAQELNEEGRHYLEIVRSSARRLGQLIEDLLLLVRVGRSQLSRQCIDLSALAQEVARELQLKQPERNVALTLQPGLTADADTKLLRIVLENLLGNAWKFTSKTAAPDIQFGRVERSEGAAYFVRDNGVGFNTEYAGRLFTPFQRLHAETEFPGTGIGLAVVRRIIERHGGRVWAEAAVDRGATFFFTLPPAPSRSAGPP